MRDQCMKTGATTMPQIEAPIRAAATATNVELVVMVIFMTQTSRMKRSNKQPKDS